MSFNDVARAANVSDTTVKNAEAKRVLPRIVKAIEDGLTKLEAERAAVHAVRSADLRLLVERTQEQLREALEAIVLLRRRQRRGDDGTAQSSQ